MIKSVEIQAKL